MAGLNIDLPDDLHDEVRRLVARRGMTIKGLVIVELRRAVEEAKEKGELND